MKHFTFKALFALIIAGMFILSACSDNSTTPTESSKPTAPTNLQATSLDSGSIKIRWTASTSESDALFAGYVLTYGEDGSSNTQTVTLTKDKNPYTLSGLTEGKIYKLTLAAKFTNGNLSDSVATVKWSPASRFVNDAFDAPIQVFEYASAIGSGIQLYDPSNGGPHVRKADSQDYWDLGLDTKVTGTIKFGSATKVSFGGGNPAVTEISDPILASSLDDVYDSQALSTKTFAEKLIDLTDATYTGSIVLIVRSAQQSSSWNYAKVLIEKASGGFLQGSSPDRYVKIYVSYQMKAGVPYAKINH